MQPQPPEQLVPAAVFPASSFALSGHKKPFLRRIVEGRVFQASANRQLEFLPFM